MKNKVLLIFLSIIILIVITTSVITRINEEKLPYNACSAAYACVKSENNLYKCKYCKKWLNSDNCKEEIFVECEFDEKNKK